MRQHNLQENLTRQTDMPQVRQKARIQVVAFEPWHVQEIDPNSEVIACAEFYKQAGPAYSALENGKPIAAAGLIVLGKMAHAWGVISDAARARPFFLHRTTVNLLAFELARYRVETVIVLADNDFPMAAKWIERMGFKEHGHLTCYVLNRRSDG